ncbi:hypothetical protein [Halomonas sp. SCS19]|uniref:hypothetical protein n=1 Tax=Halomonas sp. SCS19 TaxID=2950870 RepID=UPI0032DFEEE1
MALDRIKDLNQVYQHGNVVEWESPQGQRYRYERNRGAVGRELDAVKPQHEWYVLEKNDLTHAKRRVFDLINEDEF